MQIHKWAEVHPSAILEENVTVGPFTTVGPGARIGAGTRIAANVNIEKDTVIGKNCRIHHGACLGGAPQIYGFKEHIPSCVKIGDGNEIREYVTIHRSGAENGETVVGDNCMLMAYTHIAHDCRIGNHVIIVNYTGLPGHIEVGDRAFISGLVGIHQYARVGRNAMVGGMAAVRKDVLPFSLVEGNPARLVSINAVGLRRCNFPPAVRSALKHTFQLINDPELNTTQAIERIEAEVEMGGEVRHVIDFIKNSSRGITK